MWERQAIGCAPERKALLSRACDAGYTRACFFRGEPKTATERIDFVRRGCAFAIDSACSTLLTWLEHGELDVHPLPPDFGLRWVKQLTPLTPESDTSVELIAHPGAQLYLLDVVDDTAYAFVRSFVSTDTHEYEDPLFAGETRPGEGRDDGVVVSLPAAVLGEQVVPLRAPVMRADAADQARTLYGAPTAKNRGVPLRCGPVDILADLSGNVQQLRQVHEGVEVRGYTRRPLEWSWEENHCPERFVSRSCTASPSATTA